MCQVGVTPVHMSVNWGGNFRSRWGQEAELVLASCAELTVYSRLLAFVSVNVCGNVFLAQIPIVERSVCTSSTWDNHAVRADALVCATSFFLLLPPLGLQSIVMSMCVCLSVCMLTYVKDHSPNFTKFSVCVAMNLSMQHNQCTSDFVDDIIFDHNGWYGAL